jgi:SAM-dependent MidA family methyltransferase
LNELTRRIATEIARRGPLPFSEVMEAALYDPEHGFYASGGAAGRRGDFITSPEVGPLFGAVIARALDTWWRADGCPDPFVVVEAGAGAGTLARTVLDAVPECAAALRYVLVERSAALRARHREHLSLESPAFAFAPDHADDDDEPTGAVEAPVGPIVVSLEELPRIPVAVVLANELLDNLPVDLTDGPNEVRVALDGDTLVETMVPAATGRAAGRVPVQGAATKWLRDARAIAGRVVVFDYADTTEALAVRAWTSWLRTYRGHRHGSHPLADLGEQDITCEVAVDQLPPPSSDRSQADWLRAHGLDALVDEGRRVWAERAATGDLAALKARSRVTEADALLDPAGLGAFRVLEW